MTTIAANKECMAADRKVVDGDTHYKTAKIQRVGQAIIGAAGSNPAIAKFMQWIQAEHLRSKRSKPLPLPSLIDPDDEDSAFAGLVLTPAGLFVYDVGCYPDLITDPFYAIGSGKQAALAAMHLGATPHKAVEVACLVDNCSDGPVDCLFIGD